MASLKMLPVSGFWAINSQTPHPPLDHLLSLFFSAPVFLCFCQRCTKNCHRGMGLWFGRPRPTCCTIISRPHRKKWGLVNGEKVSHLILIQPPPGIPHETLNWETKSNINYATTVRTFPSFEMERLWTLWPLPLNFIRSWIPSWKVVLICMTLEHLKGHWSVKLVFPLLSRKNSWLLKYACSTISKKFRGVHRLG